MSMIFQSYAIWPNMTVEQNVAFGLKLRKLPREEVRRASTRSSTSCSMGHLPARYPAELSGGQQQRVALARAIVIEPQVLLLDEPLSNLDANLREEMRFEIRRLHDEFRITTVYVTHDQAEAMVTSDRIVVMNHGRIEQVDEPHTLYNRPKTRFVAGFIGRTNFIEGDSRNGADRVRWVRAAALRRSSGAPSHRQDGRFRSGRRACGSRAPPASGDGSTSVGVVVLSVPFWASTGIIWCRPREAAAPLEGHDLASRRHCGRGQCMAGVRTTPNGIDRLKSFEPTINRTGVTDDLYPRLEGACPFQSSRSYAGAGGTDGRAAIG